VILGLGCDVTKVKRFKKWPDYSQEHLLKIFSKEERQYCFSDKNLILQRLAVCFASKEAFFKAFSSVLVKLNLTSIEFSFMFACKFVSFSKTTWDVPILKIDWLAFEKKIKHRLPQFSVDLSVSHESDFVFSVVILYD